MSLTHDLAAIVEFARGDQLAKAAGRVVGAAPKTFHEKWDRLLKNLPKQGMKSNAPAGRNDGIFHHARGASATLSDSDVFVAHNGYVQRGYPGQGKPDRMTIDTIHTPKPARKQKAGSSALDATLVASDRAGVTTRLEPAVIKPLAGKDSLTRPKLLSWYKSRGFEPIGGSSLVMQRTPGPGSAAPRGSSRAVGQARWLQETRRTQP